MRERQRAAEATAERRQAEKSFDQAQEAVDFLTRVALQEMPREAKLFQVRKRLLETSLSYYQTFVEQRKDDAKALVQLNNARITVSTVLAELAAVDQFLRLEFERQILGERAVQEDLGLTAAQAVAAEALAAQARSKGPDSTQMTSGQMREWIIQDARHLEMQLNQVLSPAQSKRLREISRQIRGPFAWADADVATALELSADQKNRVGMACTNFRSQHRRVKGPNDTGSEEADMHSMTMEFVSWLTHAQQEQWRMLTGEPYLGPYFPYEVWFVPRRGGATDAPTPTERHADQGLEN